MPSMLTTPPTSSNSTTIDRRRHLCNGRSVLGVLAPKNLKSFKPTCHLCSSTFASTSTSTSMPLDGPLLAIQATVEKTKRRFENYRVSKKFQIWGCPKIVWKLHAKADSEELVDPPKVEEKIGVVPNGLSSDSDVAKREAKSISKRLLCSARRNLSSRRRCLDSWTLLSTFFTATRTFVERIDL